MKLTTSVLVLASLAPAAALADAPAEVSATSAPEEAPGLPSPEETRAEFEAVCAALRRGDDRFYGERGEALARAALAAAGDDPGRRAAASLNLARHLLRLDRPRESAAILEQTLETVQASGFTPAFRQSVMRALAMALLQEGEDRNCVHDRQAPSCILPITAAAMHRDPGPVRRAARLYLQLLRQGVDDPLVRWLANLTAMLAGDYPAGVPERVRLPAGVFQSAAPFPAWRDVAPSLGVASFDWAGGAVVDDLDGDGFLDLVSSSMHPCAPMKAFRNTGAGAFDDVAHRWGLDAQLGGLNLQQTDYDGDGRLDLLVLRGGWQGEHGRIRRSLLRNDLAGPSGRFVDVTAAAGLAAPAYPSQTAAWADYDGDGDLDVYVGNEGTADLVYPSQLFQSQGDGTFRDVAAAAGVAFPGFAKGVAWGDYDEDGDPDLYVSCAGPNRLYRNEGDGTFRDVTAAAAVAEPSGSSFATWFFDADNDGDLDLWVNGYSAPPAAVVASYMGAPPGAPGNPVLYRNLGGGRFQDVSAEVGLTRPLLPMGSNFGDLDGDGFLDVVLGTGIPGLEALMPNVAYRNDGGARFDDVTFAGGFGNLQKGHGVAFGDLDHDGDQDFFQQLGGAYPADAFYNTLLENPLNQPPGSGARWLTLLLEGRRANRPALGARIEVQVREGERRRSIHRVVGSGGSFGASTLRQEIGLGAAEAVESVVVRWPGSGAVQRFTDAEPNHAYRAIEGEARLVPLDLPPLTLRSSPR